MALRLLSNTFYHGNLYLVLLIRGPFDGFLCDTMTVDVVQGKQMVIKTKEKERGEERRGEEDSNWIQ